ncbi:hypothetical protein VOLCADRAFT_104176 [Volvox carteri f. nagariensis]|uniref:Uncharacterized protein n=1 Tax=Volvox carteri f. nagariensis TaxID=3068 RepID=D8TRX8_VOLCA|nr:uncharacterized protein VOLCADRAFT_104176 [Volvox carteri f. nagariensis]EFJ49725.1 hypothetical protein VOLCADRAFT_104176 [Volvox carteri f. nagariensis]|eukprot:XP_002949232.1 hypothetical protein VOLCADRAFT_104176 [Volvox carteri f. nagariensis]
MSSVFIGTPLAPGALLAVSDTSVVIPPPPGNACAAASATAQRERRGRPFSSPDSDESFAFDRPPYASDGGVSGAAGEQASPVRHHRHGSDASSAYAQGSWQQQEQPPFMVPSGDLDGDEANGNYDVISSVVDGPYMEQRQTSLAYEVEYPSDVEGMEAHEPSRDNEAGMGFDDVSSEGGHTLSELEQQLNQTIKQFNIEEMRVPTSKDMVFGMAHADGPFDISDIWAVESQPSGSMQSASQRPASPSIGGISREGHEVNSYSGMHRDQTSVSQESSYSSAREPQAANLTVREWHKGSRPGSAQARLHSPRHGRQQQQQQTQKLMHQSLIGPVAHHGARGSLEIPRRQAHQQQQQPSLLAQHGSKQSQAQPTRRAHTSRTAEAGVAIPRRSVTPTARFHGEQPRPSQSQVTPHYAQPLKETRLEQLCKPRNERVEKRCQQLRQEKEEEELRDCTFQPQTGRPPSAQRVRADQTVHDRLYGTKPAWQLKREEILREREQAVLASCTFQPQCGSRQIPDDACRSISAARRRPASAAAASGGLTPYVPIHQRVADLLRSRNEKLAKAQIQMELGGGSVTFQPEVNRRSAQLAAERQRQQPAEVAALPASERLYRLAQEAAARRREAGDEQGSVMRDVSTSRDQRNPFLQKQPLGVPSINPRSRALAESSDLPQDFLARQAYLAALGHEKRALYRSLLEESTCTFQPQLLSRAGSVSSSCGLGTTPRGGSVPCWSGSVGDGDRLSKLAYQDVQRSAALRGALEQHHYGQYTFTPKINERSRKIGRRHSLTDLYRNEERQAKLERLAAAAEVERSAECTFRPAINPRSASLGRQRRGSLVLASVDGHEQANKLRSSILTEARALREYEELKECTFTPAINRTVPKPTGPIAVPGLGRHMELRELARKKREADEARKAQVWHLQPKSPGPCAGITVPRPFSFETRVLPWQVPRAQLANEQQDREQQQRKALAALKLQRQQQRKHAEERRSTQLQKILQEANAASHAQHHARNAAGPVPALLEPAPANGNGGRRRSVTFQSPVSGDIYGPGSPRGVAEMPADVYGRDPDFEPEASDVPYGGDIIDESFNGFAYPSGAVEELSRPMLSHLKHTKATTSSAGSRRTFHSQQSKRFQATPHQESRLNDLLPYFIQHDRCL